MYAVCYLARHENRNRLHIEIFQGYVKTKRGNRLKALKDIESNIHLVVLILIFAHEKMKEILLPLTEGLQHQMDQDQ